ncbi:GTPase HflX [Treponema zuelzerae]|uniref:GTPase HflX n=1 Tax=Teretinema zuelzerae TaxID=156 RepID=A0AAE3JIH5_9SPIR|nr:GTPase HflX [Teretinema zuelzerae]MCD1654176.1 GTPase HflX [Teretinema zuelzerae]
MIDLEAEGSRPRRALLVGRTEDKALSDHDALRELSSLVKTAGLTVAGTIVLRRNEPSAKFGMGSGKAEEISLQAQELDADEIVFDFEISPTQQRNWDSLTGKTCLDRQEVIIRIFAARAITREAVLQVELARMEYSLPRLTHAHEYLSRQRGGAFGNKGSGETQLELDRRGVMNRIALVKKELKAVRKDRATMRKRRERVPVPSCAIVGYTNAGKSSLLNALTDAGVLSEDKLFATLDPTTKRYSLPNGRTILLTDTVGFIRNLPHTLVDAFHATLEEAVFADAVLIVLDASDPDIAVHEKTTKEVLSEVGAADRPVLTVLNKIDRLDEMSRQTLRALYPDAVSISAKTREGFQSLISRIDSLLGGDEGVYLLPHARQDLVAFAHREGSVSSIEYGDEFIRMHARSSGRLSAALAPFAEKGHA